MSYKDAIIPSCSKGKNPTATGYAPQSGRCTVSWVALGFDSSILKQETVYRLAGNYFNSQLKYVSENIQIGSTATESWFMIGQRSLVTV